MSPESSREGTTAGYLTVCIPSHLKVAGADIPSLVIPDYAKMIWIIRAPTSAELLHLRERIVNCLQLVSSSALSTKSVRLISKHRAGALATGCTVKMKLGTHNDDLQQNGALGAYARPDSTLLRLITGHQHKNLHRFINIGTIFLPSSKVPMWVPPQTLCVLYSLLLKVFTE